MPEGPRVSSPSASGRTESLAIKPLLHPAEESRLVLALVAAGVGIVVTLLFLGLFTSTGPVAVVFLVLLVLTIGSVWVLLQINRAALLGAAVQVTEDTLPELQGVVDEVKARLDYRRPVDVYVAARPTHPASLTSFLGTKVILLEGDLVAELLTPEHRPQLTFLLGRFIGALKARHYRLELVVLVLRSVNAVRFVNPFIYPYYRATEYSGDQIGLVCCGDLQAALSANLRLMAGKDLEPAIATAGVIEQSAAVSRRSLPRLAQILAPAPHLTNRYINLLAFARQRQPEAFESFRGQLEEPVRRQLDALTDPASRQPRVAPVPSPGATAFPPTPTPPAVAATQTAAPATGVWDPPRGPPAADSPPPATPPGWYPDPWAQASRRWWDGSAWTSRTS